ncbi:flagellar biosynthesis repressor FlbT [Microvirga tunisiensis]|uniref:Flagellar biosynthesis repressor FlbT n=2 Tax=Pannonibacter tanglangensis TaxID=2750084 RepID=A0A7X5J927_9HYPH|nr:MULTISPECIES: flagellar biosynthesis repressor FlbT [unclassified Pannonibacter]NBN64861.1 flagellar biosynthesis repressor FlbT [Pannonibacter sp. XCT-34]NBN79364.1 flagellar biosynthesis repressor FlbT [Pannonibacter sp. XCT-53]
MHIALKAGERIYINGAVLRVDRKTSLELMNNAVFLLESHVLQAQDTTTPLRQIYFVLQSMLMDPVAAAHARDLAEILIASTRKTFSNRSIVEGLDEVEGLMGEDRLFDALKTIRSLYPIEAAIMSGKVPDAARAGTIVAA